MKLRGNRGQVVALYAIALPVLLSVLALTLDGGKLFVIKIHLQNAADAAALASAQDLGDYLNGTSTPAATRLVVKADVNDYASHNMCGSGSANRWLTTDPDKRVFRCAVGGAGLSECALAWDAYPNTQAGRQARSEDTNCYMWPYIKNGVIHDDQVETRITKPVNLEFARIVGFNNPSYPMKRSVATFKPELSVTTTPDTPPTELTYTDPDTIETTTTVIDGTTYTTTTVVPGDTHTTTTPETTITNTETTSSFSGGSGAVAFAKSTDCLNAPATLTIPAGAAMQWSGAPSTFNQVLINGGIAIDGANTHHSDHIWLGKRGVAGCERYGAGADVTRFTGPFPPMDWPVQPPPAPPAGCISTGVDTITKTWQQNHGPGHYCWTGDLTVSANNTTFNGYSFYAPKIAVNSNSMTVKNATPLAGQPPTVFYAYGFDKIDPTTGLDGCATTSVVTNGVVTSGPSFCAFSFNGGGDTIIGDIFAPHGSISLSGGGASVNGGNGFMEAQKILVSGNFSNYQGTGPGEGGTITTTTNTTTTVIPASTQTTTDPDTTVTNTTVIDGTTSTTVTTLPGATHTTTFPGSTGSTVTSTTSTDIGLGE
jgi:hypothetical protein